MDLLKWLGRVNPVAAQRERLALAQDQNAVLLRQIAELKAQQAAANQEAAQAQVRHNALLAQHEELQVKHAALDMKAAALEADTKKPKHFAEPIEGRLHRASFSLTEPESSAALSREFVEGDAGTG